jgi:hypothetical protein
VIDELCDLDARIVYFPVRHHSPACARHVSLLIRQMRPEAVLIEGPFDFNARLDELFLPHILPIAIYSYVRLADRRRGAYHPFCVYSPEWQALLTAREIGATIRFIDLPWSEIARFDDTANRYADLSLRRGEYIRRLCHETGVENFDDLWDRFFENDDDFGLKSFLRRCHHFCLHTRLLDEEIRFSDRQREAFMAQQVREAAKETAGRILVVTGGYHSSAIHARLTGAPLAGTGDPKSHSPQSPDAETEVGIALTPYSYERLDSLRGYDAGMPNPGFYHQVWQDRLAGAGASDQRLMARVVKVLRKRGQAISSADLIAAESTARGLAQLRGHPRVWRQDLVDGIIGALIKEERAYGIGHPLLDAVHEVFRGGERGVLAEGTVLPPLVQDLRRLLADHEMQPETKPRELELELHREEDRARSRVLHRLRILAISGFERIAGTDIAARSDLSKVWERWRIRWSPEYDATTIEAARYGPTLAEAANARLSERSQGQERSAESAALLVLDASLAGVSDLADAFLQQLADLIRGDSDFFAVTKALGHLLYLYIYDQVLATVGRPDLAALLIETFARGLWLLEGLGQVAGRDRELVAGIRTLLDAFERCENKLHFDRGEYVAVLSRASAERSQRPLLRGAAMGALWTIGESDADRVRSQLLFFADPDRLGDFLAGLFALAREVVQRHRELVMSIDQMLVAYADEEFLTALPSLRLAFTFFTPREKHHIGLTLLEALGLKEERSLSRLDVPAPVAAQAIAFESRIYELVAKYGLRGGQS